MVGRRNLGLSILALGAGLGGVAGACSGSDSSGVQGAGGPLDRDGGGYITFDASATGLAITPPSADIVVNPAGPAPTPVQFELSGAGDRDVIWRLTNPALGTIDQNGRFTPGGLVGGQGEVEAVVGGGGVRAHITVTIAARQNGGTGAPGDEPGAGGLGGVGGEGEGGAVPDDLLAILEGATEADAGLSLIYPYDRTVFPLGILPPLLQWRREAGGNFQGVYVRLSAPPYFEYKGFFARPARLGTNQPFVRHPIPKAVWQAATVSAAGGDLTLEVVLARGGQAYGPLRQTWHVALSPFSGKVYYQAYATRFVQNEPETAIWGDRFGGATLSVRVGSEEPELVAGATTDGQDGCRVCHSVSAYGDTMIAQHGDSYADTSVYDLKNGNAERTPFQTGTVGWSGLYPDGTIGLSNSIDVTGSNSNDGDTALYDMTTGDVLTSPGLSDFATRIALPAFSPDGRKVAFTLFEGDSTPAVGPANGRKLVAMDFNLATRRFSNPVRLWQTGEENERPAFVTFLPSSDGVIFQRRIAGTNNDALSTWYGARGDLWWVDLATQTAAPLDNLNGVGVVPDLPNDHAEDELLNYEPSVSPVASGGYAWIVFMSRRAYGNVATRAPWESDPRNHDIRQDYTTKKLWMAAIDLNPRPGEDPSHPAFYIPGQEIQGVNSRPFFALDPCVSDRGTCSTGIDCCSGFCRDGYCQSPPVNECSQIDERCEATTDCCDPRAQCIGGFCAILIR